MPRKFTPKSQKSRGPASTQGVIQMPQPKAHPILQTLSFQPLKGSNQSLDLLTGHLKPGSLNNSNPNSDFPELQFGPSANALPESQTPAKVPQASAHGPTPRRSRPPAALTLEFHELRRQGRPCSSPGYPCRPRAAPAARPGCL